MNHRSGWVAVLGRPNTGKSTLVNKLAGAHISITSRRPQTTRFRILGVHSRPGAQIVYVDTPGLHPPAAHELSRYLNRVATGSLEGVDAAILLIDAAGWHRGDDYPLAQLRAAGCPVVLAINKIDRLRHRNDLLPLIESCARHHDFAAIVPVSALKGENLEALEQALLPHLPEQDPIYPPDTLTDKSERFLAAELIREQIFRGFSQEVPYDTAVHIERFRRQRGGAHVEATILVSKEGQKAILIGQGGSRLKEIGTRARKAMQTLFGFPVHLDLWVKVKRGWADDARELRGLGYTDKG
jgi:GTP-binding protein Era